MSEENINNNGEETAALFVSAQKKKKAEEEAKKKAAEEQAKREAAEAEVRRMEQEVEERKRKAEEEAKALEEEKSAKEAGQIEGDIKNKIKETASAAGSKAGAAVKKDGKLNLPVIIGAAAAVLVIIILIVVLGGKGGKGSAIDLSQADFNAEYTMAKEGYTGVKLSYPDAVFGEVSEEDYGEEVLVKFTPSKGSNIQFGVQAVLAQEEAKDGVMSRNLIGMISAKDRQKVLTETGQNYLNEATIASEESADVTADNAGIYYYKATYETDSQKGAIYCWIEPNGDDVFSIMTADCASSKADPAVLEQTVAAFAEKNSGDALKIPGANPPTASDTDGMLEVDEIHMGLPMPKGQFVPAITNGSGSSFFFDDNGAIVLIVYDETDVDFDTARANQEILYAGYKEAAETSIQSVFPSVESRMFLNEEYGHNGRMNYYANYKDMIGGIPYYETYLASHWRDVRTQKYYFYDIIMIVPEKNKDVYQPLFDKALDRIADI